ncbi:uncharacterized protein LOC125592693 [Brassica napus]|uniref:uncharacterized protein LOC125592693 n=1 Tax=Brassica napus TaxID=3708 RepID=UPI002079AAF4|nr:uncharacterized protein LOC125592693 [Brassica napus]
MLKQRVIKKVPGLLSLWVAWFTKRILSRNINNFWALREKQSHSYTVKKLLRCRDLAFSWIKAKLGNGRNTMFWFENWTPFGGIKDFLRLPSSSFLGTRQNATVSDINHNGAWSLPSPRSEEQLALQTHLTTITLSTDEDSYIWSPEDKQLPSYSTGMIYKLITLHKPQVPWYTAVWTTKGIPKHNFLAWMMVLNRCPTKDMILSWGLQTNPNCLLCNNAVESRDHLYFVCPFSFEVWEALAIKSGCHPVRQWSHSLTTMQSLALPKHQKLLSLLSWQSTIYLLWTERNHRLHRQQFHQSSTIITNATSMIKNQVSSLRNSSPRLYFLMMLYWLRD